MALSKTTALLTLSRNLPMMSVLRSTRTQLQLTNKELLNSRRRKLLNQITVYFKEYVMSQEEFLDRKIKLLVSHQRPYREQVNFCCHTQLIMIRSIMIKSMITKRFNLGESRLPSKQLKQMRAKPIPEETEEWLSEVKARTVYCKGFPKEAMNIDKLLEFFKQFPTVVNIKMRYYTSNKDQSRHFKGTANVTFSSRDEAEKFMTLGTVKYNDYSLQRQWSVEWEKEKAEENEARRLRKEKNGGDKKGQTENTDENGNGKEAEKEKSIVLPRGAVLKLVNLSSNVDRDEIKSAFNSYPADIAYVEITPENTAFVRLRGENDAKLVLEKLVDQKMSVGEASVGVSVLEGDEETEYIKKAEEHLNNRAQSFRGNRGRGGGRGRGRGGRGGRGGYRGQKRSGSPSGSRGSKQKQSRDE
uniref:EOG090X0CQA n=1 Tax=Scapholeberis mucronata TaxID=202097 RepID=A0A4Y7NKU2_9CRUS|nr:EOG090X0CQA [Scapholeberis mucronata]SVE93860.1 EOG090X0CQA [Scapholeberis mucronata]